MPVGIVGLWSDPGALGGKSCWLFPVVVVVKCPVSVDVVVKCLHFRLSLIWWLCCWSQCWSQSHLGLQGLPAPVCCQLRPIYLYSSVGCRYITASHILGWGGKGNSWWQNACMCNCACSCTSKTFFSLEFCGTVCQWHSVSVSQKGCQVFCAMAVLRHCWGKLGITCQLPTLVWGRGQFMTEWRVHIMYYKYTGF